MELKREVIVPEENEEQHCALVPVKRREMQKGAERLRDDIYAGTLIVMAIVGLLLLTLGPLL